MVVRYACFDNSGSVIIVPDTGLSTCSSNRQIVWHHYDCISTQSAILTSTTSAVLVNKFEGFYQDGLFVITLGLIVLGVSMGALLGRFMFPKSL